MSHARSGGKLLVECLVNQGVNTAFGVPGESYLDVLDALYDAQNQIRMIVTRHEGGAAFMAEAYGKLTGKPGICFVTRGPGATNAAIGVHTAMQNSTPMILFVGQIGREMRDREAFQEVDYRAMFGTMVKWATEIDDVDRIPETIARAFTTALSGRPGPVVVALPEDMLRDLSSRNACLPVRWSEPAPALVDIDKAIARLRASKRPLLIIGGGGWTQQGRQDLHEFVSKNNLPVAVAFRYQDLVDSKSSTYVGDAGVGMSKYLKDLIGEADVIFGMNIRFGESTTEGWSLIDVPNPKQALIHSHISDRELGKIYQAEISIHASPNHLAAALAAAPVLGDWREWQNKGRSGFLAMRENATQSGAVNMVEICAWLRQNLDDDCIVTNGAGNFAIWPSKFLDFGLNRRLLAPQSGAMGAGLPAAIAAKTVDPARQVLCFAGDGDIQMTLAELGTAAQENLRPIVLVLNNGMYGTIRAHQEKHYPNRVSATKIVNPDFVAIAKAYGFHGERVTMTGEFVPAFQRANASANGAIIEIMIDPEDISPFSSISKIRGTGRV